MTTSELIKEEKAIVEQLKLLDKKLIENKLIRMENPELYNRINKVANFYNTGISNYIRNKGFPYGYKSSSICS